MSSDGINWVELISNGGVWMLAVAAGWAVMTGRLRLEREFVELETRAKDLAAKFEQAIAEIDQAREREIEALRATNERLHQRLEQLAEALSDQREAS